MTQEKLILRFIRKNGSMIPAKHVGSRYDTGFFGSEIGRRCRELRKVGLLQSEREGKFVRFFPTAKLLKIWK